MARTAEEVPRKRLLQAGVTYFALVFLAGWILGPIRVLLLRPRVGEAVAVLIEAPFLLAAMIAAAQWVTRRQRVPADPTTRLAMGLVAFALLTVAEIAGATLVRGIPLRRYLAGYNSLPGLIAILLYLLFAVMPLLVGGGPGDEYRK